MRNILCEPIPDHAHKALSKHSELLRTLLYRRGIGDGESASAFLNPDYEKHTHDPFLMKGMEEAVSRIFLAIQKDEKIVIFSDYDADGVPGGIVLHDFFKKIGFNNFLNYIPHRHDEGFGLNSNAIEELVREGAKLMITVDCGIADAKEVAHAKSLGIETIITDHHLPLQAGESTDSLPPAIAILDPKQKDCPYPFKELCGAGVVFKLIQALLLRAPTAFNDSRITFPALGWEKWLLDLVGLATLSDMVPLVGENRVFAHFGLIVLRKSHRPGLQKLLRKSGVNQRMLSEDDVVFSITPKINAASRLGSADVAFRLLSTEDESEANTAVDELLRLNNERKGIVGSLVKEVRKIVAERYNNPRVIVAGNPKWRPGLLGLVANSLAQEYSCPVFLWGRDGDNCLKGSCRSDGKVNLMEMMQNASDAFVEFGGHAFSGGFTLDLENVHGLEKALGKAREGIQVSEGAGEEDIAEWKLSPDEVSRELHQHISKLSPFGCGNKKPLFLFEKTSVKSARRFGKEKNHLEIQLSRSNGSSVKAIQFFTTAEPPREGDRVSLLANMEQSSFGGRTELRLKIVQIL